MTNLFSARNRGLPRKRRHGCFPLAAALFIFSVNSSSKVTATVTTIYASSTPTSGAAGWFHTPRALGAPLGKSCDTAVSTGAAWNQASYSQPYEWLILDNFDPFSLPIGETVTSIVLAVDCGREPGKGTATIDVNFFGTGIASTNNTVTCSTDTCAWRGNFEVLGPVPGGGINYLQAKIRRHSPYLAGDIYVRSVRFVITSEDVTPPVVTLTSPNGGEVWADGTTHQITWTATDNVGVSSISLGYSTNGGNSYTLIASGEANDGVFNWIVPNAGTVNALVRATARDTAIPQNSGADISNSVFTISSHSATSYLPGLLTRPMVLQNRPNPFNPSTRIGFGLPTPGHARLTIFSASGRLVRTLADGEYSQGYSEVEWDGRNDGGEGQASGVYYYRFEAGAVSETRRLVMSK